jgi:hypothetical protein
MAIASVGLAAFVGFVLAACTNAVAVDLENGVNDVRLVCEQKRRWTRINSQDCLDCQGAAPSASCECEAFRRWSGRCSVQRSLFLQETTCNAVIDACVLACGDCACVDGCYANAAACRVRASAVQGCVAEVCRSVCE